jgi:uncharacterized protein YjiS (DUF1127 family)
MISTAHLAATLADAAPRSLDASSSALRLFARIRATLALWRHRMRQRDELAGLNDHMLRDIGLTRGDVVWEVAKPFWRA